MYPTTPSTACAITVALAGDVRAYPSISEAVTANAVHVARAIRARGPDRRHEIRIQVSRWAGFPWMVEPSTPELEFFDEIGFPVPAWLVEDTFIGLGLPVVRRGHRRHFPHVFRQGPVPGIGKRYGGRYYRSPKTTNERRAGGILMHDEEAREHRITPRKSRIGYELPSSYDDVRRTLQRSWKSTRRTQWKD